jgi:transcription initiation factor TFIIH subunit 4
MVSSGTGQNPKKPSNGVLFLLERSGLMLNFESAPSPNLCVSPTD